MTDLPALVQPPEINDRWVFFGLLAILVWAPLPLGSNRYWAVGILILATVVLLIGMAVVWRKNAEQAWQRIALFRWPLSLLAGMVALAWLQTLELPAGWISVLSPHAAGVQSPAEWMTLSLDVYQSRYMASLSFTYFSIFLIAVLTVRQSQRLSRLAQVLVWSGVVQAVLGVVLFSVKAEYRIFYVTVSHARMIGSYVYHNSLAGYLCMTLSIGIGLMLARLGTQHVKYANWKARLVASIEFILSPKMRLRMLLIVMVIALVLTRSRMGNTAFFSAMLVVGGLAMVLVRKTAPQTMMLIASLVIIDIFVVGTWVGLERVVERIQDTEMMVADGGKSESVEARTETARTALAIVQDFPLAGTGGGSFYSVFMGYLTPLSNNAYWDHTHNDFVEIASDFGLLGLGILGLLVASTLWTVIRVMAKRKSSLPWGMAFGVAMSVVALLIHSAVDFNMQIPANALTFVTILAMGWIAQALPSRGKRRRTSHGENNELA